MSDEGQQTVQLWVRTEKAQVFGPLTATSVELLLDNGVITGRVQVSFDGMNYVFPGRMPGVRVIFPRELWGEPVVEGAELDAAWQQVVLPPALTGATAPAAAAQHVSQAQARVPQGPAPGRMPGPPPGPASRAAHFHASQVSHTPSGPLPRVGAAGASSSAQPTGPLPAVAATSAGLFGDMEAPRPSGPPMVSAPSGVRAPPPPVMHGASGVRPPPSSSSPSAVYAPPASSVPVMTPSGVRPVAPAPAGPPVQRPTTGPSIPTVMSSGVRAAPAPQAPPGAPAGVPGPPPRVAAAAAPVTAPAPAPGQSELPRSGAIAEVPVRRLYALCAASNATALLSLQLNDRTLSIHFKRGAPEFVDSSHPEDTLEAFLLGQGLATPQQLGLAEAQKARFGGELLPALFGLGLINPNSAFQQLSERAAAIVFRAFVTDHGSFTLLPQELPSTKAMPLGNRWALYLEQLRRVPTHVVQQQMASAMDLPVMRAQGLVPSTDLRLQPQEARALTFFDGTRTLSEVQRDSGLEGDVVVRTAWMLADVDLVSFAALSSGAPMRAPPPVAPAPVSASAPKNAPAMPSGVRAPAAGPPPGVPARNSVPYPGARPQQAAPPAVSASVAVAPAAPAPARPVITPQGSAPVGRPVVTAGFPPSVGQPAAAAPRPPPTLAPAAAQRPASGVIGPASSNDARELALVLERMKKQNFFEILGLGRNADTAAVKVGYLTMAKNYHPDTVPPGSPESLMRAKADIFGIISEANRTLSDPKLRADYLAEVEGGTAGEKVDVAQLLQAEELFQRGCVLVKARKFPEAVKALDEAIKANDREGEYFGWRGYARFFTYEDKSKAQIEAMKEITLSIKMNPNAAPVHYFLGFLNKNAGELQKAKAAFKRCVELDPRHIDAMRELRMMK